MLGIALRLSLFLCVTANILSAQVAESLCSQHTEEGRRLQQEGKYAMAEEAFQSALKDAQEFGRESLQLAASLNNLASVDEDLGLYADAESLYERSLLIFEKLAGADAVFTLIAVNHLAGTYLQTGRYGKAELLFQRCPVAEVLANLALLQIARRCFAEAESLLRRAVAIYENPSGGDPLEAAVVSTSLACAVSAQGRYTEALTYATRSSQILEHSFQSATCCAGQSMEPYRVDQRGSRGMSVNPRSTSTGLSRWRSVRTVRITQPSDTCSQITSRQCDFCIARKSPEKRKLARNGFERRAVARSRLDSRWMSARSLPGVQHR